jgi:hypothetical protein
MRPAMRFALLVVAFITLSGTARAKEYGLLIPPVELDIGVGAPIGEHDVSPSTECLAGLHWASLAWKPTPIDFGVGYVGSFRDIDRGGLEPDRLRMHGGYITIAMRIAQGRRWRTWLGTRGELFHVSDKKHGVFSALGGAARVSTEIFGSTKIWDRRGKGWLIGTVAFGIYVEATVREIPSDLGPVGLTSGISVRLPFFAITT